MNRRIAWFSCGAASAIAAKLARPDIVAYCETGAEDIDNDRFLRDCEPWFGMAVTRLRSEKYRDTWDVWERRRYIAGNDGAPCTGELKVQPRLKMQQIGDVHIFGYTADKPDVRRAKALREHYPDIIIETPLIDAGLTKAACIAMLRTAGIREPRTYAMGYPNANCIPCCKATSPDYWALVRLHHPEQFDRMAVLSRELGARLARINDKRVFIDEIPIGHPVTQPIAPECDFLCSLAEQELMG